MITTGSCHTLRSEKILERIGEAGRQKKKKNPKKLALCFMVIHIEKLFVFTYINNRLPNKKLMKESTTLNNCCSLRYNSMFVYFVLLKFCNYSEK